MVLWESANHLLLHFWTRIWAPELARRVPPPESFSKKPLAGLLPPLPPSFNFSAQKKYSLLFSRLSQNPLQLLPVLPLCSSRFFCSLSSRLRSFHISLKRSPHTRSPTPYLILCHSFRTHPISTTTMARRWCVLGHTSHACDSKGKPVPTLKHAAAKCSKNKTKKKKKDLS